MRSLLAVPVLLLVACGDASPPALPSADSVSGDSAPALEASQDTASVRPGVPLDSIVAVRDDYRPYLDGLAAPRRLDVEPVPNEYDPAQIDTLRTYVYDGLVIATYGVAGSGAMLTSVEVTDAHYGPVQGVRVGATRAEALAALGVDDVEGPTVSASYDDAFGNREVVVTFAPDADGVERVAAVVWNPYTG